MVGVPPRARSRARLVASWTASTSFPSTRMPSKPQASAFWATEFAAVCPLNGIEIE